MKAKLRRSQSISGINANTQPPIRIRLHNDQSTKFAHVKSALLVCLQGDAWVTCNGFFGEIRVRRGQSTHLERCHNLIITAATDSILEIWRADD